jgi:hypothetical protein
LNSERHLAAFYAGKRHFPEGNTETRREQSKVEEAAWIAERFVGHVKRDVGGAGRFRLPEVGVGECHAKLLEVRVMAWIVVVLVPIPPAENRNSSTPDSRLSVNSSGFQ